MDNGLLKTVIRGIVYTAIPLFFATLLVVCIFVMMQPWAIIFPISTIIFLAIKGIQALFGLK